MGELIIIALIFILLVVPVSLFFIMMAIKFFRELKRKNK